MFDVLHASTLNITKLETRHHNCQQRDRRMPYNGCSMPIWQLIEKERTRESWAIPRIKERYRETLAMEKKGSNQ